MCTCTVCIQCHVVRGKLDLVLAIVLCTKKEKPMHASKYSACVYSVQ